MEGWRDEESDGHHLMLDGPNPGLGPAPLSPPPQLTKRLVTSPHSLVPGVTTLAGPVDHGHTLIQLLTSYPYDHFL